ncbi:HAD family hydrolase [Actinokineospora iranica]|uniref:HAD family hydrolase n=1 Tax=Actinokineospora iranica TaxID=1271860 RepID=UPI000B8686DE|nr:HAD family phosphatase [Actinokineospora iranica]
MNPSPAEPHGSLQHILADAEALLLDFDGPVCSVFAGFPANIVADQLRDVLIQGGHADLPPSIVLSLDPFDILFHAAKLGGDEARYVEAAFTAHEVDAIKYAVPTPNAHEFIRSWHKTSRPVAIVSNNSSTAIEAYCLMHDLSDDVAVISARGFADPTRLKPNPFLLNQALDALAICPGRTVFIGDSKTDIQAGRAAGVRCIGFANSARKIGMFSVMAVPTMDRFPLEGLT